MATTNRWSRKVTETSNALDLEHRVFTKSPREIARSLKRSAERYLRAIGGLSDRKTQTSR